MEQAMIDTARAYHRYRAAWEEGGSFPSATARALHAGYARTLRAHAVGVRGAARADLRREARRIIGQAPRHRPRRTA
jgi:hypothetical protein